MDDLIITAIKEYGIKEDTTEKSNPAVVKYYKSVKGNFSDDSVAWCSAFVNWVAQKAGYVSTKLANARSWLSVGVSPRVPTQGDIVILWRVSKTGTLGHVGILMSQDSTHVHILGGNQSDMVCISKYPLSQVLGYRRLSKAVSK